MSGKPAVDMRAYVVLTSKARGKQPGNLCALLLVVPSCRGWLLLLV